jgi:hypothetical protein
MKNRLKALGAICAALAMVSLPAVAADDPIARGSLKGIKAVYIGVDPLGLDAIKAGLTDDLLKRGLAEKLRTNGIKVLERQDPSAPVFLFADVTLNHPKDAPVYVYTITLSLKQLAYLKRDSGIQLAVPTWALTRNGVAGEKVFAAAIHKATLELGDKFCAAFKAANAK